MKFSFRFKSSVLYISFTAFITVAAVMYAMLQSNITENELKLAELKRQHAELNELCTERERELSYVQSEAGIELYAHLYGYKYADEICYTAVVNSAR